MTHISSDFVHGNHCGASARFGRVAKKTNTTQQIKEN